MPISLLIQGILSKRSRREELSSTLAPAVRTILGSDEPALITVFARQLHDDSYQAVSIWPGSGYAPDGLSASSSPFGIGMDVPTGHALPRLPALPLVAASWRKEASIQWMDHDNLSLLIPAHGFKDLCGFLEIVPVQMDLILTPLQSDNLLLVGQAAGLCLERDMDTIRSTLREDALQAQIGFLNRFADRLSDGILIISDDGVLLHLNRSAERLTGLLGINTVGLEISHILPAPAARAIQVAKDELVKRGHTIPRTVDFDTSQGPMRWQIDVELIRAGREVTSCVATLRDLHHRQYLSKLLEVDRLKNDFLSTLSHELRTPITTLRGYAWLLHQERDKLPEHLRDAVSSMEQETVGLCGMVENLLFLADPEQPLPADADPIPLGTVIGDVIQEYNGWVGKRGITIESDIAEDPLFVNGETERLRLMVINIIDNAVKFSPDGSLIKISWRRVDGGNGELRVEDQGPGMTTLAGTAAFDPFQQGGDALVGKPPGLGLGLAIVRRVVEELSGRIETQAGADGGTRMNLILPLAGD
ncbi:MAG: PAS domain-containing sensor histidine kinase [Candidatus Eisenbacteria bacterium]|uniref:histidine kinase n=1 Tax=Eiseniibacteriota bacterium TaxID=2212470 RepID=A0A948RYB3_UNCEI|nr:PAS domain-containing sensor histidine kinase [Candidatus Eisenbacteria bacterium]